MNVPQFAQVLGAVIRKNIATAQEGGAPRDYLVPMAWGDPGLGKTEIVESVADDLGDLGRDLPAATDDDQGWKVVYADLQTRDPAELGGMPWIENRRAIRCRPDWLPTQGRGILFLDELPQAGLANMNIAASLIRDHRIGEHVLPPAWTVVCAGNHQHNRAGTTTMPSHVRNRLVHLNIEADVNAWAAWAARRGIAPLLIAYNRYRASEFHHRFSATENAYPSPRSWAMTDRVLQLALPEAMQRECVAGAIGGPASADFTGFQQIFRSLPDIDAILLNPEAGPLPDDAMTSYALMGALAHRATPRNFAAVVRYLDRLPEQEFSVACVLDATARDEQLTLTTAYQSWAAAHGAMLSGHQPSRACRRCKTPALWRLHAPPGSPLPKTITRRSAMDISARALLVNTTVRVWTGEKRDRAITREICSLKGAEDNAVRANKSLLGEDIKPVQAAERAVRAAVNERTLPWMDDGTRILKGAAFLTFTENMAEPIRGFDAAVDAFIGAYPEIRNEARRRLGSAYADSDFPSQGQLRDRFGVRLTYLPVPSSNDFRVQLAAEEIAAVRRNAEDALRGTVNDAVRALLDRLREPVAHMATRLRLFRRRANGKVEHPFRDTLVENVRQIVKIAPMLNLMDDPRIAEVCADIERNLTAYDPDQLRSSPRLREDVANQADDILRRMQGAFA